MSWHERPYSNGGDGGGGGWRFADNPLTWAPAIGSVAGIRIRIHILFILYILFELLKSQGGFAFQAHLLLVLFGSVFLHELGHCFAARHVGGRADEVLLWPLGGLAFVDAPRRPWPQFVTVIWGPLVNVILAAMAWSLLRAFTNASNHEISLNPLAPFWYQSHSFGSMKAWCYLVFKLNYVMLFFNLLCPMYPMDSGRILQCALWSRLGLARSMMITTTVGMVAAIMLGMFALTRDPMNFSILAVAMLGYMICMQERQMVKAGMVADDGFGGFDVSAAYTRTDRPVRREGWLARWKRRRMETQRENLKQQASREQAEVDRILAKVHDHGLASLSRGERRTLETATRRQREQESSIR